MLNDFTERNGGDVHRNIPPRLLIIGAGARGDAYARAVTESTTASIVAVAEPIPHKREALGRKYIWGPAGQPAQGQSFDGWKEFAQYEQRRRKKQADGETVPLGVDGIFICTMDETHVEIVVALAPLGLHVMCEKPLATTLGDCLKISRSVQPDPNEVPTRIFAVGHVLRYSPHNILLRKLVVEDEVVGDVISVEHTEPVGWWHFSHSYVRGHWRKESTSAPSLLTKSCHDIDILLWLLCSPRPGSTQAPHLPTTITSTGSLVYFKRSRKPLLAGEATNCLSCPAESECMFSARKIYEDRHLRQGHAGWPVNIVDPEIEDCLFTSGQSAAVLKLRKCLAEDYDESTSQEEIDRRPWFGRCVYESDNNVCDDQVVTIRWEDDPVSFSSDHQPRRTKPSHGRGAKTAILHMTAFTDRICERRGRIYGTRGEIVYDSRTITVHDFASKTSRLHHPHLAGGGHGGGDSGLTQQFVQAIDAVKNHQMGIAEAQRRYVGCSLDEIIISHAMVFAAEEARRGRQVVDWKAWWGTNVEHQRAAR